MRRTTLAFGALAASWLVLPVASGYAGHVGCGSVLFEDTELDSNLVNCPDDGLVIGADGVVVKLKGFILSGSGVGNGVVAMNRKRVSIQGPGVIREFVNGVLIIEGSGHRVRGLTTSNNTSGGIVLLNSKRNAIRENASASNGFVGIQMFGVSETDVAGNNVFFNETGIRFGNSNDNMLRGNSSQNNEFVGIRLEASRGNAIEENALVGNNTGVRLMDGSSGNHLGSNVIVSNGGVGVFVGSPGGNRNNRITGNTIVDSFVGVRIFDQSDINTRIRRNTFSSNTDQIQDAGAGTIVEGNNCVPADASPVCN